MKFTVNAAARAGMWNQWDWYVDQGAPRIAQKFLAAVEKSYNMIAKHPKMGAPRRLKNPRLEHLRVWPIKGFNHMRVYYLVGSNTLIVIRILHDRRDTASILEKWMQGNWK